MNPSEPILKAYQLSKQVKSGEEQLHILRDINLEVHPGASVAILGISGAGKSTLLSLLAGLDLPTAGDVFLAGKNLSKLDEDGRAAVRSESVGFVFQSFHLVNSLTALENVMLPLELVGRSDAKKIALEWLNKVRLEKRAHHYPRHLSGGEQQRLAIARAFAANPKLLFADEPTGNLDKKTGERIIDLLFELNRTLKTTLVLVTHDENLAARCEKKWVLEEGQLSG